MYATVVAVFVRKFVLHVGNAIINMYTIRLTTSTMTVWFHILLGVVKNFLATNMTSCCSAAQRDAVQAS